MYVSKLGVYEELSEKGEVVFLGERGGVWTSGIQCYWRVGVRGLLGIEG